MGYGEDMKAMRNSQRAAAADRDKAMKLFRQGKANSAEYKRLMQRADKSSAKAHGLYRKYEPKFLGGGGRERPIKTGWFASTKPDGRRQFGK